MAQPAAKQGDKIVATDMHIVLVPSPGGPVPTLLPHPFNGTITTNVSANVKIMGKPAATQGSSATNLPPHIPSGPGPFQIPPQNQGEILKGSTTVRINGKAAARVGDMVQTCQDPAPNMAGQIVLTGPCTVMIGG